MTGSSVSFPGLVAGLLLLAAGCVAHRDHAPATGTFNVRDYGATGRKSEDARPALQQAIDACAAAGRGTVYLPPGEYTSGTLRLRSHVRLELARGATLFASPAPADYPCGPVRSKAALLFGEELEEVSIGGQGTIDGQAQYEWREDDYEQGFDHKTRMIQLGKSLNRSFPKGFPKREVYPHLLWLGGCQGVQVSGLRLVGSPSWTVALYGCERAVFTNLFIHSSLQNGVWADGIDLDGCKDVTISRCHIETGDDCIVFISTDAWGPARVCENISVDHCQLASASAGIKFSEANRVGIRNVRVTQTRFTGVNRGVVFNNTLGGDIADVLLSDLTIDCRRRDWFWAGDGQPFYGRITRVSELNQEPPKPGEVPPGTLRRLTISNVVAYAKGSSLFQGHAESRLEGLRIENLKLHLATDPQAPYDQAEHALVFRHANDVQLKNVEVHWQRPALDQWNSALFLDRVRGVTLDGFSGQGAAPDPAKSAVWLNDAAEVTLQNSRALTGTAVFLKVTGPDSRDIRLLDNDLHRAATPLWLGPGVPTDRVMSLQAPTAP